MLQQALDEMYTANDNNIEYLHCQLENENMLKDFPQEVSDMYFVTTSCRKPENIEYGVGISITDLADKKCKYYILNSGTSMYNLNVITTFCNSHSSEFVCHCGQHNTSDKGIYERIFSNRTEYFLNGQFVCFCCQVDTHPHISQITEYLTKTILEDKMCPALYDFIKSVKMYCLIPKSEIDSLAQTIFNYISENEKTINC